MQMGIDTADKVEMYVLIFCRNITLEYLKANEVTLKSPVVLICLFAFTRTKFFMAKFVCHC